ncbi:MAG: NTP transferase domain-containing protein [Actinomycetota bacterium]|nr:NTP transferase domain-containing protein [Actinomycetota bacterium]
MTAWDEWEPYAAVLLAGGRSSRLDGIDKSGIELSGRTMLAWALDAVVDAMDVVVVGDAVHTERPVTFVREDPRFGGPVAALLTGVDALLTPRAYVGVIAVDMPFLRPRTLSRLREAAFGRDGAVLVGPDERRQLALVLSAARLAEVRPDHEAQHGMPMRMLLADLDLVEVPSEGDEHRDIDTWTDLKSL